MGKKRTKLLYYILDQCGLLMTRVGVIGFLIIAYVGYIYLFVPQNLKNELTRKWLLLEGLDLKEHYFIVILFIVIIGIQYLYYEHHIKIKNRKIDELIQENIRLQTLHYQQF